MGLCMSNHKIKPTNQLYYIVYDIQCSICKINCKFSDMDNNCIKCLKCVDKTKTERSSSSNQSL